MRYKKIITAVCSVFILIAIGADRTLATELLFFTEWGASQSEVITWVGHPPDSQDDEYLVFNYQIDGVDAFSQYAFNDGKLGEVVYGFGLDHEQQFLSYQDLEQKVMDDLAEPRYLLCRLPKTKADVDVFKSFFLDDNTVAYVKELSLTVPNIYAGGMFLVGFCDVECLGSGIVLAAEFEEYWQNAPDDKMYYAKGDLKTNVTEHYQTNANEKPAP